MLPAIGVDDHGIDGLAVHCFERVGDDEIDFFSFEFRAGGSEQFVTRFEGETDDQLSGMPVGGDFRQEVGCGLEFKIEVLVFPSELSAEEHGVNFRSVVRDRRGGDEYIRPWRFLSEQSLQVGTCSEPNE